jgi:hypothetical protein
MYIKKMILSIITDMFEIKTVLKVTVYRKFRESINNSSINIKCTLNVVRIVGYNSIE